MSKLSNRQKAFALFGLGALAVSNVAPATAAAKPTVPACDATASDAVFATRITTYNNAVLATYTTSPAAVKLTKDVAAKTKLWKAAKNAKAKAAAKKALDASKKKQATALAAFKKTAFYYSYAGSVTPEGIAAPNRDGLWNWGTYTTRIVVNKKALTAVCTLVDESAAGNNLGATATEEDKQTSLDLYQMPTVGMDQEFPGTLPIMWYATLAKPASDAATISGNVDQCIVQLSTVTTAPCIKGGLAFADMGGLTGATYTVGGYSGSLQAALSAAVAAGQLVDSSL